MARTKDDQAPRVTRKRPKGSEEVEAHAYAHRAGGPLSQDSLRKAPAERQAMARAIRDKVSRKSLGGWTPGHSYRRAACLPNNWVSHARPFPIPTRS